jgi:hypothetical protein
MGLPVFYGFSVPLSRTQGSRRTLGSELLASNYSELNPCCERGKTEKRKRKTYQGRNSQDLRFSINEAYFFCPDCERDKAEGLASEISIQSKRL